MLITHGLLVEKLMSSKVSCLGTRSSPDFSDEYHISGLVLLYTPGDRRLHSAQGGAATVTSATTASATSDNDSDKLNRQGLRQAQHKDSGSSTERYMKFCDEVGRKTS